MTKNQQLLIYKTYSKGQKLESNTTDVSKTECNAILSNFTSSWTTKLYVLETKHRLQDKDT